MNKQCFAEIRSYLIISSYKIITFIRIYNCKKHKQRDFFKLPIPVLSLNSP